MSENILILALEGGDWYDLSLANLTWGRTASTHWIGCRVDLSASLTLWRKDKYLLLLGIEPNTMVIQRMA
jgi:hypothetical protein